MAFDYSAHKCTTTLASVTSGSTTSPPPSGPGRAPIFVSRPQVVTQLASGITNQFRGFSSTLMPRDTALLDSTVMAGTSYSLGSSSALGIELYHDVEHFVSTETNTFLGYIRLMHTATFSTEFSLGATDSQDSEGSLFAGVRVYVTLEN